MKIGCSWLSNTIYAGSTRKCKDGFEAWIKKEDVTEQAIRAVFEHMYNKAMETGYYQISFEKFGTMSMTRKDAKESEVQKEAE